MYLAMIQGCLGGRQGGEQPEGGGGSTVGVGIRGREENNVTMAHHSRSRIHFGTSVVAAGCGGLGHERVEGGVACGGGS